MVDRDPRFQPKPGDVLTNGQHTFYVVRVDDDEVFYTQDRPPEPALSVTLDDWRSYAKCDSVLEYAKVKS